MGCEVKEVIISDETKWGDGSDDNPIRQIIKVFDKDGLLIAINDPWGKCESCGPPKIK